VSFLACSTIGCQSNSWAYCYLFCNSPKCDSLDFRSVMNTRLLVHSSLCDTSSALAMNGKINDQIWPTVTTFRLFCLHYLPPGSPGAPGVKFSTPESPGIKFMNGGGFPMCIFVVCRKRWICHLRKCRSWRAMMTSGNGTSSVTRSDW